MKNETISRFLLGRFFPRKSCRNPISSLGKGCTHTDNDWCSEEMWWLAPRCSKPTVAAQLAQQQQQRWIASILGNYSHLRYYIVCRQLSFIYSDCDFLLWVWVFHSTSLTFPPTRTFHKYRADFLRAKIIIKWHDCYCERFGDCCKMAKLRLGGWNWANLYCRGDRSGDRNSNDNGRAARLAPAATRASSCSSGTQQQSVSVKKSELEDGAVHHCCYFESWDPLNCHGWGFLTIQFSQSQS